MVQRYRYYINNKLAAYEDYLYTGARLLRKTYYRVTIKGSFKLTSTDSNTYTQKDANTI